MNLLLFIEEAFADRERPATLVEVGAPIDEMYADALAFKEKSWKEVTCADLEKHRDAPFAFNPDAFCYFLPGIFSAGIRESRPDLLVNDSIISSLDFSSPDNWGDYFQDRWFKLNKKECEAAQHWLLWIADSSPNSYPESVYPKENNPISRAFDTINYLIDRLRNSSDTLPSWVRGSKGPR